MADPIAKKFEGHPALKNAEVPKRRYEKDNNKN